jgi:hypothetical protein
MLDPVDEKTSENANPVKISAKKSPAPDDRMCCKTILSISLSPLIIMGN